jgi:hypothetical protein
VRAAAVVVAALDRVPLPRINDFRVAAVEVVDAATDLERRHLEDLRDAARQRIEERRRTTAKQ